MDKGREGSKRLYDWSGPGARDRRGGLRDGAKWGDLRQILMVEMAGLDVLAEGGKGVTENDPSRWGLNSSDFSLQDQVVFVM